MTLTEAKVLAISENPAFEEKAEKIEEMVNGFSAAKTMHELDVISDAACKVREELYSQKLVNGREDAVLGGIIGNGMEDHCHRLDSEFSQKFSVLSCAFYKLHPHAAFMALDSCEEDLREVFETSNIDTFNSAMRAAAEKLGVEIV